MMNKITLTVADDINNLLPLAWPCRIEAVLADGSIMSVQVDNPKGDPDNPIHWQGIIDKFKLMTDNILTPQGQSLLTETCENLESLTDMSELMRIINRHGQFG